MKPLKLVMAFAVCASLSGCITPQEIYKHRLADAGCEQVIPEQGGKFIGCVAGLSGPKA
jgi:hypothetical protein